MASIQDEALNEFIEIWLEKVKEYGKAYHENTSARNNEAAQTDLNYFNKSHEILAAANELKEKQDLNVVFANVSLENSPNNFVVQPDFLVGAGVGAPNEGPEQLGENNQRACRVGRGYGVTGIKPMTVLPLPLIEPDLPICSIRLSEAFHRFAS